MKITLDAYPKVRFAGTIKRIAPAARLDEKVKVFDVEIAVDRQGAELRTGMTANVDIIGDRHEQVLTVPVEAIFRKDEAEVVYVKKPEAPKAAESPSLISRVFASGEADEQAPELDEKDRWKERFELREVETGLSSMEKVEIVAGLEAGRSRSPWRTPPAPRRRTTTVSDASTDGLVLTLGAVQTEEQVAAAAPPLIELTGVTKTYDSGELAVQALGGIDLKIETGQMVAVIGPSGSGQVDADAHPRLPGRAQLGDVPSGRSGRRRAVRAGAGGGAQREDRLRVPDLQPAAQGLAGCATWSCP